MIQWVQLFRKECLEMWRNFKWIWVPLVFIVLGMTDPLTTFYMPLILESVGNLPEGAVIEMPVPSAGEVLMMSTGQFNMLGVLVVVFASMSLIASERRSGVAGLILVRPVPYASYVTSKWAALLLLGWISLFLGYLSSWYYINVLFDSIPFLVLFKSYVIYGLWFSFILTLVVFFNAVFKVPGLVAFVTLTCVILISILTNIFEQWLYLSPAMLIDFVGIMVTEERFGPHLLITLFVTIIAIISLLAASIFILRRKELAE